ncbi:hypothetical protein ACIQWZ_38635 [Streptomyces sp. NPDC098077]|uniref:hypothetical protein n=1 Tax=Streptomyces sp. NPDC098077 TaxID=3366093 RepID=UPI003808A878
MTREELYALRQRTGMTTMLHGCMLADRPMRVRMEYVPGRLAVSSRPPLPYQASLGTDAPGLAILAYLPTAFANSPELRSVRERGYARKSAGDENLDVLSVPLLRHSTPVGSVSVTGRHQTLERHLDEFVDAITGAAENLSSRFGRRLPD